MDEAQYAHLCKEMLKTKLHGALTSSALYALTIALCYLLYCIDGATLFNWVALICVGLMVRDWLDLALMYWRMQGRAYGDNAFELTEIAEFVAKRKEERGEG